MKHIKLFESFVNEGRKKTYFVDDLIAEWEKELGPPHPNAPHKSYYSFFWNEYGQGWMTRLDGKRYKDMNFIMSSTPKSSMSLKDRLKDGQSSANIKTEEDLMDWAWNKLKKMAKGKEIEVSGAHGSDEKEPAVIIGDYVFIFRETWGTPVIKYASKSILKNFEVWRS